MRRGGGKELPNLGRCNAWLRQLRRKSAFSASSRDEFVIEGGGHDRSHKMAGRVDRLCDGALGDQRRLGPILHRNRSGLFRRGGREQLHPRVWFRRYLSDTEAAL
jgi:hypothetical protein